MKTKICNRCQQTKSVEEFYRKGQKNYQSDCIVCTKQIHKQHYLDNKESYKYRANVRNKIVRQENQYQVLEYLKEHHCVDCGTCNPIVLHFDHVEDKKYNISDMLRKPYSWETIKEEIEKCEVRCANCHAIKTAADFNWYSNGWVAE